MNALFKRVELLANVAIVVVALLLSAVIVKRYLLPAPHTHQVTANTEIKAGTKLSLQGIDWVKNGQTLLLVLSKDCRYCTESVPFYQRLAQERAKGSNPHVIAILPQSVEDGQKYLTEYGVVVDEVRQAPPSAVGARATPTLILTDNAGVVVEAWVGKLPAEKESEVLSKFQPCGPTQQCS